MNINTRPFQSSRIASPPPRPSATLDSQASEQMDTVEFTQKAQAHDDNSGMNWGKALGAVALLGAAVAVTGCVPDAPVETTTNQNTGSVGEIDLSHEDTVSTSTGGTTFRSDGTISHDLGNGTKIRSDGTVGFDVGNGTTINTDGSVDFDIGNGFSINSDGGLNYNFGFD
jgi:hypothetical protein